ncbi:hypothetical protein [Pseudomonas sp. GL-B-26]|uniref:hypothetical protein n=1 Tax=Pseudomonas sp. GL-B-26 TaxID=2832394 RepID=UPI001CBCFA2A|nr:hypothetical protein [Pseudomonas sp. GL-B-26]
MAKSNADIQRDKRAKEKALLERIGAVKRTLIVSKRLLMHFRSRAKYDLSN